MQHLSPLSVSAARHWQAHAEDPQFFVQPERASLLSKAGWLVLSYDFVCESPTFHQVFLNRGLGYESDYVISKTVDGSGCVEIAFRAPGDLQGLRLDPAAETVRFDIDNVTLQWFPELPDQYQDGNPELSEFFDLEAGVPYRLEPVSEVKRCVQDGFHWISEGEDPHFLVKSGAEDLELEAGWYRCGLEVNFARKRQNAKFYFDSGMGFNESDTLQVLLEPGAQMHRLLYLPRGTVAVRFDPQEKAGPFKVSMISLEPVLADQAKLECAERIKSALPGYASLGIDEIFQEIAANAEQASESPEVLLGALYAESYAEPPGIIEYEEWIADVEEPSLPDDAQVSQLLSTMPNKPRISVLVPVYNTEPNLLRRCLESVMSQSYADWELCVADDASSAPHVRQILEEYEARDSRVRVAYRAQNGHISAASNSALELADGEFIALLDHDDELAEHALLFIAQKINEVPETQIIYSDEDKIDLNGRRSDPHFKSRWNPDLFYSQNYVSHLGVYRADLIRQIGGFRVGLEGSQDQDLLLRCLPHVRGKDIVHIPKILYHWRAVVGSTAQGAGEKSYTTNAGVKALQEYFAENGPEGTEVVEGTVPNTYRVIWPVPDPEPLVSLLIPTRDRRDLVEVAVRSILEKTTYQNFEILILDNGSVEPETLEFFEEVQHEDGRVRILRYDHPFNYSAINNFGVEKAKGSIVGLINNDIEVISPDWLSEMVSHASRDDIGCVGAKLYYSNDTIQHAGVILGLGGVAGHSHKHFDKDHPGYFHRLVLPQNLSAVTAACLLVRREVYEAVGGLDETNLTIAFNDVDFCLKVASAGYRNLWSPYAELYHHESVSRGQEDSPEKIRRFQQEIAHMRERWGDFLDSDPCYSQNLTRDREDFSIGR